jgi:hypothetical protein
MRLPQTKRGTTTASVSSITPTMEIQYRIELKGRPLEILELKSTSAVRNWSNKRNRACPRSKWLLEHADGAKRGRREAARSGPEGCAIVIDPADFLSESRGKHPGETGHKLGKRFDGNEKTGFRDGARTRERFCKRRIQSESRRGCGRGKGHGREAVETVNARGVWAGRIPRKMHEGRV